MQTPSPTFSLIISRLQSREVGSAAEEASVANNERFAKIDLEEYCVSEAVLVIPTAWTCQCVCLILHGIALEPGCTGCRRD